MVQRWLLQIQFLEMRNWTLPLLAGATAFVQKVCQHKLEEYTILNSEPIKS